MQHFQSMCVGKSMQTTHTHTQKLAQVHHQCMILLTHASDTPRLGDTGHYVNMILAGSQVSPFPWGRGGSRAVYHHMTWAGNKIGTNKTFLSVYRRDGVGLDGPEAGATLPEVLRDGGVVALSALNLLRLREAKLTLVTAVNLCCHQHTAHSER